MARDVLLHGEFQLTEHYNHCLRLLKTEVAVTRLAVSDDEVNSGKLLPVEAEFLDDDIDQCDALIGDLNDLFASPAGAAAIHFVVHHSSCYTSIGDDEESVLQAVGNAQHKQCEAWEAEDECSWQKEQRKWIQLTQHKRADRGQLDSSLGHP